jgi:3-oxoacyl-[acyl-carrier protein] reductase
MQLLLFFICLIIIIILFLLFTYFKREINFKKQKYLSNKIILITGGSLGIGRELIHLLITLFNCQIINLDMRESEFESIKKEYKDKIVNIPCNISKIKNIIKFLKDKKINPDEIDIIINNAGVANNLLLEELSENQMISTIEINLLSPMKIIKSFIENSKTKSKKIHFVTLCSVMSHVICANSSDYISSKWGLYGFVESVRSEYLYNDKYIFTTICPFAVNTGMFPNFFLCMNTKYICKEIVKSIALKEEIKFIPNFINIPIFIYKLFPNFICKLIQHYIINRFSKNIGRREENDALLNKKFD